MDRVEGDAAARLRHAVDVAGFGLRRICDIALAREAVALIHERGFDRGRDLHALLDVALA